MDRDHTYASEVHREYDKRLFRGEIRKCKLEVIHLRDDKNVRDEAYGKPRGLLFYSFFFAGSR